MPAFPVSSSPGTPEPALPTSFGVASPTEPASDNEEVLTGKAGDSGSALRLIAAREALASADPFLREAGTQMLVGMIGMVGTVGIVGIVGSADEPENTQALEALALLEKAGRDGEARVRNGALRALTQAVANGKFSADAAETTLLRLLTRNSVLLSSLRDAKPEQLGQIPTKSFDARRLRFLADYPDLVNGRLKSIEAGQVSQVQAERSRRLRHNPAIAALFAVVRRDPDLAAPLKAMLARRTEFRTRNKPNEMGRRSVSHEPSSLEPYSSDIRRMTGLLAGLGTDERIADLAQLTMDRTARRETETFWEMLRQEVPFVPEIVVGAGPHSANLCSTLATLRPHCLPLVVESRPRTGGPFAQPGGAAWNMNSRVRPAGQDRRTQPGGDTTLNSLGPYAPVQEADLTGQSYATQNTLALATRLSLFLSAQTVVETTFVEYTPDTAMTRTARKLPERKDGDGVNRASGTYLVQLRNERTGESGYVTTDTMICAGGLGQARSAFSDRTSKVAIAGERERAKRGERPRYLRFEDLMARLADGINGAGFTNTGERFSLRGIQRVIVIGAGDSARVAIEALLGYGPTGKTSPQTLDRVREIVWMGQKAKTREEFLVCERPRYHLLATEFPRASADGSKSGSSGSSGNARIRPISYRAKRFVVEGEQAVVTEDTRIQTTYGADLVVDCSGFGGQDGQGGQHQERGIPVPLAKWTKPLRAGSKLRLCDDSGDTEVRLSCSGVLPLTPLTPLTSSATDFRMMRYSGTVQSMAGRYVLTRAIAFETGFCDRENIGKELEAAICRTLSFPDTTRLYLASSVLPLVSTVTSGMLQPVARQEDAQRIYYIGPKAGLPSMPSLPTPARDGVVEKEDTANTGGGVVGDQGDRGDKSENRVALWRYAESVTAFAEYYVARVCRDGSRTIDISPLAAPLVLPLVSEASKEKEPKVLEASFRRGQNTDSAAEVIPTAISVTLPAAASIGLNSPNDYALFYKDSERRFRYLILEHLHRFRLPEDTETARTRAQNRAKRTSSVAAHLHFTPVISRASGTVTLTGEAKGRLAQRVSLETLLVSLLGDEDLRRLLLHWGFPTAAFARSRKSMTIIIPLRVRGRGSRLDYLGEIKRTVRPSIV